MKKILSYILSPVYLITFGVLLLIFHPVQVFALNVFGYNTHRKSVELLNYLLYKTLLICGVYVKIIYKGTIPLNKPLIVVSNHQSMFDIPPLIWIFRNQHLKFISKQELGKGIPSVSYNLRRGGSVLIDRNNKEQAVSEIKKLAERSVQNNYAVCIFPEGTRSKDGMLKQFHTGGLETLLQNMPGASIIPVAIKGSKDIAGKRFFPIHFGVKASWVVLPEIKPPYTNAKELAVYIRDIIQKELNTCS